MRKLILIFLFSASCFGARVGLITDTHHTDRTDRTFQASQSGPRFYSESVSDVTAFSTAMNLRDPDVVIENGDFIETSDDGDPQTDLNTIEDVFDNFLGPFYHVIGNWALADPCWVNTADFMDQIENGNDPCVMTLPTTDGEAYFAAGSEGGNNISRYYAFELPDGVIGIVLDSNGRRVGDTTIYQVGDTGLIGGGQIPDAQRTWLTTFLDNNTSVPIVVFMHHRLWPENQNINHVQDTTAADDIRAILERNGNVVAVFQGHVHPASQKWWDDTTFENHIDGPESSNDGFVSELNGIKYYILRSLVLGWGAGETSTSDSAVEGDFETWGETTPASVYYLITVGRNRGDNGEFYVHAKGFGANPGGLSDSDNLLARWKLDDEAGQTSVKSTNGNQNGTSDNDIVRGVGAPANFNRSMLFVRASNDVVTNEEIVVSQYPFTFSGWFKTTGGQQGTIFAINGVSAANKYAVMIIQGAGFAEMGVKDGFTAEEKNTGSTAYDDDRWHHMVATFADKDIWNLYVDGKLEVGITNANKTVPGDITNWSIGGKEGSVLNDEFDGSLADIRVYDIVLNANEIRNLFEDGAIGRYRRQRYTFGDHQQPRRKF